MDKDILTVLSRKKAKLFEFNVLCWFWFVTDIATSIKPLNQYPRSVKWPKATLSFPVNWTIYFYKCCGNTLIIIECANPPSKIRGKLVKPATDKMTANTCHIYRVWPPVKNIFKSWEKRAIKIEHHACKHNHSAVAEPYVVKATATSFIIRHNAPDMKSMLKHGTKWI